MNGAFNCLKHQDCHSTSVSCQFYHRKISVVRPSLVWKSSLKNLCWVCLLLQKICQASSCMWYQLVMMLIPTQPILSPGMKAKTLISKSMRLFWTKNCRLQEAERLLKMHLKHFELKWRECLKMLLFSIQTARHWLATIRWHNFGHWMYRRSRSIRSYLIRVNIIAMQAMRLASMDHCKLRFVL